MDNAISTINSSADSNKESSVLNSTNKTFVFNLTDIDCFEEDNKLWFKLSDIGFILELSDSTVRKMKHDKWFDDDEINTVTKSNGNKGNPNQTYVSESALYRILNRSNSSKAKPFERWITKEVIPSIRKTGKYEIREPERKPYQPSEYEENLLHMRKAELLRDIAKDYSSIPAYYQALNAYATKELTGKMLITPVETEKTYSATDIAEQLGISVQLVGIISNKNNLKIPEYSIQIMDLGKNGKQIPNYRYNQDGYDKIVKLSQSDRYKLSVEKSRKNKLNKKNLA